MKKLFLTFFITTFFASSANSAEYYKIDPNHANIVWFTDHFGFSKPSGKFNDVSGTIKIDERNPQNSSVEVEVKTTSIVSGIAKFDSHLKNADFLNVKKFPIATFKSTKVLTRSKNSAIIQGNLTLLGVTKPITINATLNKIGNHPFTQKKTVGFSGTSKIKRSQFGMNYGIPGVSDEVELKIEVEAWLMDESEYKESTEVESAEWIIVPQTSELNFKVTQNKSVINGSFKKFDGSITFDPNKMQNGNINIDIDTSSIEVAFDNILDTIKSSKWLATTAFPTANFKARSFVKLSGENDYQAKGHLTLKGKSIPTTVTFTLEKYEKFKSKASGTAKIRLSDFNIGEDNMVKKNDIGNEVEISFVVDAKRY